MNLLVVGQKGDGPVRQRRVTLHEFFEAWGPYAKWLYANARAQTVVIDDCKVRVAIVE